MYASLRVFTILLRGLDILDLSLNGDTFRENAVSHLTGIFSALLSSISSSAELQTGTLASCEADKQQSANRVNAKEQASTKDCSDLDALTELASCILRLLKSSLPVHCQVFQGMLYHLLDHVGKLLDQFTSLEASHAPTLDPGSINGLSLIHI